MLKHISYFRIIDSKPHSRMWYRIGAVRNMTGGRKTDPSTKMNEKLKTVNKASIQVSIQKLQFEIFRLVNTLDLFIFICIFLDHMMRKS